MRSRSSAARRGDFAPETPCRCGHARGAHGPDLPAACAHGHELHTLPGVASSPAEGMRVLAEYYARPKPAACPCCAFVPAAARDGAT